MIINLIFTNSLVLFVLEKKQKFYFLTIHYLVFLTGSLALLLYILDNND